MTVELRRIRSRTVEVQLIDKIDAQRFLRNNCTLVFLGIAVDGLIAGPDIVTCRIDRIVRIAVALAVGLRGEQHVLIGEIAGAGQPALIRVARLDGRIDDVHADFCRRHNNRWHVVLDRDRERATGRARHLVAVRIRRNDDRGEVDRADPDSVGR